MPTTLPVAAADHFDAFASQSLYRSSWDGVLANDTFGESSYLSVTAVNGLNANVGSAITLASGGTLQLHSDGSFLYTPAANFTGTESADYTISDGTNTATATVDITTIEITIAPVADQQYFEGDAVSLQVTATASSGPTLDYYYSASNLPSGLDIDSATGLITGSIAYGYTGPITTTIYATAQNTMATAMMDFNWTIAPVEITVVAIANQQGTESDAVSLQISASVSHGPTPAFYYSASNLPNGLTLDSETGMITGTLAYGSAGTMTVGIYATPMNGSMATGYQEFTWTIAPVEILVAEVADQTFTEGDVVSLQISASVSHGPALDYYYSASNLPTGLVIDSYTGLITGTLASWTAGTMTTSVYVNAMNGSMAVGFEEFVWVIAPVLPAVPVPAFIWWTGLGDGVQWDDGANWAGEVPPSTIDVAVIDATGANIRLDTNVTIAGFTFNNPGGELGGIADLTVTESFNWYAGGLGWSGQLNLEGASHFEGDNRTLRISGRDIINTGTLSWSSGAVEFEQGGRILNYGEMFLTANAGKMTTSEAVFTGTEGLYNSGTITSSANLVQLETSFYNATALSTVVVTAGTLSIEGNSQSSGWFTVESGGTLDFSATLQMLGQFVNGKHTLFDVNFGGDGWIRLTDFAEIVVPAASTVSNSGKFKIAGGEIRGSGVQLNDGQFVNLGQLVWESGKIEDLRLNNLFGGIVSFSGGQFAQLQFESSTLVNWGAMVWNSGEILIKHTNSDAWIGNFSEFEIRCDSVMKNGGGAPAFSGLLSNDTDQFKGTVGVIRKTVGAVGNATVLEIPVSNYSLIKKGGFSMTFAGTINNHSVGQVMP